MNLQHPSEHKTRKNLFGGEKRYGNAGSIVAKILCVLAAFLLWIYVMAAESPQHKEVFENVVVRVTGGELLADQGLAIYNGDGTCIDVTLSGKKSVLTQLSAESIVATANVEDYRDGGRVDVKITVDIPSGCKLEELSSETVSVYLDYYETKTLDLTMVMNNISLPEGFAQGAVDVEGYKVTVSGARKYVEMVTEATAVFDMTGVQQTKDVKASVALYDNMGREMNNQYIQYTPKTVELTVPVIQSVTLPVKVEFKHGFFSEANTKTTLSVSEVTLSGEPELIDKHAASLQPTVVIDEKADFALTGSCRKTVLLKAPAGLSFDVDSIDVSVTYSDDIMTRVITVPGENIFDSGASQGVKYTWDKSPVTVKIMGSLEAIQDIRADDIILWLDMSPYSESSAGSVNVRAKVIFDSAYKNEILEVGYYDVRVTFID